MVNIVNWCVNLNRTWTQREKILMWIIAKRHSYLFAFDFVIEAIECDRVWTTHLFITNSRKEVVFCVQLCLCHLAQLFQILWIGQHNMWIGSHIVWIGHVNWFRHCVNWSTHVNWSKYYANWSTQHVNLFTRVNWWCELVQTLCELVDTELVMWIGSHIVWIGHLNWF